MNTRRSKLIIVSSVFLCMVIQGARANPNHLEPIRPYSTVGIGYGTGQAVFKALVADRRPVLWMIEWPSFSPPSAVMLRHEIEYDRNDNRPLQVRKVIREQWSLDHAALKRLEEKTLGDGRKVLDIKPAEDVELGGTTVPKDFAKGIEDAWLSVLELTRYGEDRRPGGLDGTTFEFCYDDDLFGQTWSPETGLPAMLVDLGRKLRTIARSDEKSKEPLLKEADALAHKIANGAEAAQIKLFGKKLSRITWGSVLDRNDRASQDREAR
jgi:hypothetical protein